MKKKNVGKRRPFIKTTEDSCMTSYNPNIGISKKALSALEQLWKSYTICKLFSANDRSVYIISTQINVGKNNKPLAACIKTQQVLNLRMPQPPPPV